MKKRFLLNKQPGPQRGFSLIELMIAVAVGLVAVGAVASVLISSSSIYRVSENRARIQENARFATDFMQRDVRMAGYMGCFNLDMFPNRYENLANDPTGLENDYRVWITGYDAAGAAFNPAIDAKIGIGGHEPVKGNDVLVVRMPSGPSALVNDEMKTTSEPIPVASVEGFEKGGLAVVSDCGYANVFGVTEVAAGNKIVHAANENNGSPKLKVLFSNISNATVTPLTTVSYFIAAASDGVSGNKALYRQERANPAEEIADGIEQMQLEYGIDTDTIADGRTNSFVTADLVGTGRVTAVKVSLLVRSHDNNVARNKQVYNFNGQKDIKAEDKRLYTPFTTTIALRNRVN